MKLTFSGVAICAGITRSPSFSRSSSSTRMNIRPFLASSMISSGLERNAWRSRASSGFCTIMLHAFQIARKDVDLDIDRLARRERGEGGDGRGVRDDVDPDQNAAGDVFDRIDCQRHAVERD